MLGTNPGFAHSSRHKVEAIVAAYLRSHPDEVGQIVLDYVARHPESLRNLLLALARRKSGAAQAAGAGGAAAKKLARDRAGVIAANSDALFRSPHETVLGDPSGDLTLVEFFDYNCGFCKRAVGDMRALLESDKKLRVALKEFPVLGPRSVDLAKVAIAVRMQNPSGGKYQAFYENILAARQPIGVDEALSVAQGLGLDRARLERDMASDEVRATLEESAKLAAALHVGGTPTYVIGDKVLVGAVGLDNLRFAIASERARKKP